MTDIERLTKAIQDLHGLESHHVASVSVEEKYQGKHIWGGIVEIFALHDCKEAAYAYAWRYSDENGNATCVAVLGAPPVRTPMDAVHAYLVSQFVRTSE
jgi:hypothetical protein